MTRITFALLLCSFGLIAPACFAADDRPTVLVVAGTPGTPDYELRFSPGSSAGATPRVRLVPNLSPSAPRQPN